MTVPAEPPTKSPTAIPPKTAPDKFDAFRPGMPQIPGLNAASGSPQPANSRRLALIGGVTAAALLVGIAVLWWIKSAPRKAVEPPFPDGAVSESSVPAPPLPNPAASAQDGLAVAATVEELSDPWAAKKFTYVKPFTGERVDAMVIRLPGGGLWAFSLQEPNGHCQLEFVTDLGRLATQFGFRAAHPMVVSPCTNTVYDPLKVGHLGGDVLVRGEIVQGGGLRPPISIDVQVSGHSIIADQIE